jgi:hypothetical protein
MVRTILLSTLVLLISEVVSSQNVDFYKENITMKIDEGKFYVSGTYFYRSVSNESQPLYYPFPDDERYGPVDSIYIFNISLNKLVEPQDRNAKGFLFDVDFNDEGEAEILIFYRQLIPGERAEYIIETTQLWDKPLDVATYQLIIPGDITVYRFSIPPDDSIHTEDEKLYTWERYRFMPDRNLVFDF